MSDSNAHDICERMRELIAWYPGRALAEEERSRVEKHVANCPACADLLEFASAFKGMLQAEHSTHPDPEALVSYVESRAAMDPEQCSTVERHLAVCPQCREEAAMLTAVEESYSTEKAAASSPYTGGVPPDPKSRIGGFLRGLRGGVLKPVPAAVYLTAAVLAVGMLLFRPDGWMAGLTGREAGQIRLAPDVDAVSGSLGGVVILPDETDRMRRPGREDRAPTRVDAGRAQFLLLELTGLEAVPSAEDRYTVELSREGSPEPVFQSSILGRAFRDNYSLCLQLGEGGLRPGSYIVTVVGPSGNPVFRSSIIAE